MFPYSPTTDLTYQGVSDAEVGSDVSVLPPLGEFNADGADVVLGQFGASVVDALVALALSSLGSHVGHVLLLRAEPEMCRVDAMGYIAGVHNDDICWDFHPVSQFISDAMDKGRPTGFGVSDASMTAAGRAVTRALPQPAFIRSGFNEHAAEPLCEGDATRAVWFEHAGKLALHVREVNKCR